MRSRSHGPLSALLVVVPLLTVPVLAVVGIPQFAPVVASPGTAGGNRASSDSFAKRSRGEQTGAADFYAPLDSTISISDSAGIGSNLRDDDPEQWVDPFQPEPRGLPQQTARSGAGEKTWQPPGDALDGWERDTTSDRRMLAGVGQQQAVLARQSDNQSQNGQPADAKIRSAAVADENPYRPAGRVRTTGEPGVGRDGVQLTSGTAETAPTGAVGNLSEAGELQRSASATQPAGQIEPASREERQLDIEPNPIEPLTWRGAVDELNRLGIRQFRLLPGQRPNEFQFTCYFTPRDNPRITHKFMAEAAEPLRAVQNVLEQIHEWLGSR